MTKKMVLQACVIRVPLYLIDNSLIQSNNCTFLMVNIILKMKCSGFGSMSGSSLKSYEIDCT